MSVIKIEDDRYFYVGKRLDHVSHCLTRYKIRMRDSFLIIFKMLSRNGPWFTKNDLFRLTEARGLFESENDTISN